MTAIFARWCKFYFRNNFILDVLMVSHMGGGGSGQIRFVLCMHGSFQDFCQF